MEPITPYPPTEKDEKASALMVSYDLGKSKLLKIEAKGEGEKAVISKLWLIIKPEEEKGEQEAFEIESYSPQTRAYLRRAKELPEGMLTQ